MRRVSFRQVSVAAVLMVCILLGGCSYPAVFQNASVVPPTLPPSPTPIKPIASVTPPCPSNPRATIIPSATTIKVGETVKLTINVRDVGMPAYYLNLSTGLSMTLIPSYKKDISSDSLFEVVSAGPGGEIVLLAKTTGTSTATVRVTGEVGCYHTGYSWGGAGAPPVTITVVQ